ncbi:MAG: DUF4249 family protein [Bacteroidota bacterium]
MNSDCFYRVSERNQMLTSQIKTALIKLAANVSIILGILLLINCESNGRFYRPNLPEKLCSIGIIDADDTIDYEILPGPFDNRTSARFISFEKSYQGEYPEEVNDSLREFSFSISSSDKEIFNYRSDSVIKNLKGFNIPADIEFRKSEKYYLRAKEESTPEISAEIIVPIAPSEPELISIKKEKITLSEPTACIGYTTAKSVVIDFSFGNDNSTDLYYAILLEGYGDNVSSAFPIVKSELEFDVKYCNTSGFFAILSGYSMYQWTCLDKLTMIKVPVYAYFIEGSRIPANKCIIKISTQFADERSPFDILRSLRVRLLSIPKTLFLFEKSLYSFGLNSGDPFSEPVYLNGNIKGGNGVFAVCRSREFTIKFSQWY